MVDEELEGDWVAERDFSIEDRVFLYDEQADAPAVPQTYGSPNGDGAAFGRFREANVEPQRQEGFSTVQVKVTRGDLTPEQFRGLAADHARVLRRPRPHDRAPEPRAALGPRRGGLRRLAAPGRARARRGRRRPGQRRRLLPGHGLLQARHRELDGAQPRRAGADRVDGHHGPADAQRIHIKMSGCPNGCSQHHIGNIGFYGASIKVGEHTIPAYVAHIGGNYEGGEIVYGKRLKVRLASKRVPEAVERWIRFYEAERYNESEVFNAFAERVGPRPSRSRCATWRCRSSSAWRRWRTSSTGRRTPVPGRARRGRMRGMK